MESTQHQMPVKKDDTVIGFVIVGVILSLLVGFMYLLSIQKNSTECTPQYNPDGSISNGCALNSMVSPTPVTDVELLDQLKSTPSEVDQTLEEAAQDIQKQINAQKQNQQSQQALPPMPGQ